MTRTPRTSPLIAAIRQGDLQKISQLLTNGEDIEEADIHGFKGLPLRTACFAGNLGIVKALLDQGANPNAQASDGPAAPLRAAIRAGHQTITRLLIERGTEVPLGLTLPLGIDLPANQMLPPDDAFLTPGRIKSATASTLETRDQQPDHTLDFAHDFSETDIEEVNIKACRGLDTSILTIEFETSSANIAADTDRQTPGKSQE